MWTEDLRERTVRLSDKSEKERLGTFLQKQDLSLDNDVEYSVVLTDSDRIVATGSFSGRILKCIAVDEGYKDRGLSARIVTRLVNEEYERGRTHLFIYTKPGNRAIFSGLGFYPVAEVPSKVILMENLSDGISKYVREISTGQPDKVSAGIVVNCNPFTRGHQYVIEHAASHSELLHIFVVWEDKSVFPAETRYRLVKEGVSHLPNVALHKGKDYIISDATFPTYFIKDFDERVETHARLDLAVFSKYIAPSLRIKKRFIGEEPFCKVTGAYNRIMKEYLPGQGIEVEEIPRLTCGGSAISASGVRELIRSGDLNGIKELVPESTYEFLLSREADGIIQRIRGSDSRH